MQHQMALLESWDKSNLAESRQSVDVCSETQNLKLIMMAMVDVVVILIA